MPINMNTSAAIAKWPGGFDPKKERLAEYGECVFQGKPRKGRKNLAQCGTGSPACDGLAHDGVVERWERVMR